MARVYQIHCRVTKRAQITQMVLAWQGQLRGHMGERGGMEVGEKAEDWSVEWATF